jgi:lysozyme family protein
MRDNFSIAHAFTAVWEGGYSNHKNDPGKATNFGVSLRWLEQSGIDVNDDGKINTDDIAALTPQKAAELFRSYFWDHLKLGLLPLPVAVVTYDAAVNTGCGQSVKFLQRACNSLSGTLLDVDGAMGAKTRSRALELIDEQNELARRCVNFRIGFHRELGIRPQYGPFLKGWINRCEALLRYLDDIGEEA